MTFSLMGRCPRTGQLGAAVSTGNMAVGSRAPWVASHVGGVLTQAMADPRLGLRGIDLLRSGCTASETLAALTASTPHSRWRQLAVLDAAGNSAWFHGAEIQPALSAAKGPDVVAIGNFLPNSEIADAMCAAFTKNPDEPLAERLIRGLAAGEAAGGQLKPVTSAAVLVMGDQIFPLVDLRVDQQPDPITVLNGLWESYRPVAEEFVIRACDPDRAKPS